MAERWPRLWYAYRLLVKRVFCFDKGSECVRAQHPPKGKAFLCCDALSRAAVRSPAQPCTMPTMPRSQHAALPRPFQAVHLTPPASTCCKSMAHRGSCTAWMALTMAVPRSTTYSRWLVRSIASAAGRVRPSVTTCAYAWQPGAAHPSVSASGGLALLPR
jgi:hypothetical protein